MSSGSEKELRDKPSSRNEKRSKLKERVKRGLASTEPKDVAVAKEGISVRKDAIVGAEQKDELFFRVVHDMHSEKYMTAGMLSRTWKSICSLAKLIIKSSTAFGLCFARQFTATGRSVLRPTTPARPSSSLQCTRCSASAPNFKWIWNLRYSPKPRR